MESSVSPESLATVIEAAPAWVKIGLTMPVQRIREDAVAEMARHLHTALYAPPAVDPRQIALPLA